MTSTRLSLHSRREREARYSNTLHSFYPDSWIAKLDTRIRRDGKRWNRPDKRPKISDVAEKVFSVTELLEHILFELPIRDLLFSQRVCKQWQAVILGSCRIQTALFLRPHCLGRVEIGQDIHYPPKSRPRLRHHPSDRQMTIRTKRENRLVSAVYENPLLGKSKIHHHRFDTFVCGLSPAWDYPEASWRRMVFTQPPIPIEVWDTRNQQSAHAVAECDTAGEVAALMGEGRVYHLGFRWCIDEPENNEPENNHHIEEIHMLEDV